MIKPRNKGLINNNVSKNHEKQLSMIQDISQTHKGACLPGFSCFSKTPKNGEAKFRNSRTIRLVSDAQLREKTLIIMLEGVLVHQKIERKLTRRKSSADKISTRNRIPVAPQLFISIPLTTSKDNRTHLKLIFRPFAPEFLSKLFPFFNIIIVSRMKRSVFPSTLSNPIR